MERNQTGTKNQRNPKEPEPKLEKRRKNAGKTPEKKSEPKIGGTERNRNPTFSEPDGTGTEVVICVPEPERIS